MATRIFAELTNAGRLGFSRMSVSGESFVIEEFEVGSGGHDPTAPTLSLTPDVSLSELPNRTFGPKAIESAERDGLTTKIKIILEEDEAIGPLSNFMLFARINFDPNQGQPLLNHRFPFAIATTPLRTKLAGEIQEYDLIIRY